MSRVTAAYSARAAEYIDALGSVGSAHPSDRQLIDTWSDGVSGDALDAGCGPGHWTDHLTRRGLRVRGIDLVPEFVEHARSTYPGTRFDVASIDDIPAADGSLGGVLSWYSTIHHSPDRIGVPLREFARVLRPGGTLLLGHFDGRHVESFDHAVLPAFRWPTDEIERELLAVGFETIETHRRTGVGYRPLGVVLCRRREPSEADA